ncbi:transmembrane protein 232 isoform X2 [Amia ocellicauda]|uniref:transmembrane protein 232 isoform X2 n=1 Tax=Amia ocellicauda TaxID=2972642 RepID=UPI003463AD6E
MPIIKIPVVHNFGIISHSHQRELHRRFVTKAREIEASKQLKSGGSSRNPFEITEEFIRRCSDAQGPEEHAQCVDQARHLLSRSKRRAGLCSLGTGHHVDLPLAWTELLLLALCRGTIQDESLDVLLVSLDHAPVHVDQVPVLFSLAESVLCWVCSGSAQKPCLYTCEVKMLQLGHLVFFRLLLFHVSGHLQGYRESKSHLQRFLKALAQCKPCYQPFPNVLFAVDFILKTGEMTCGDAPIAPDQETNSEQSPAGPPGPGPDEEEEKVHGLNPVTWQGLLAWHCVHNDVKRLPEALGHLHVLREELQLSDWVESGLGLMLLGEAAKSSMPCLQTLLGLAEEHVQTGDSAHRKEVESTHGLCTWPWQLVHIYSTTLAEICLHGHHTDIQKTALVGRHQSAEQKDSGAGGLLSLLKYGALSISPGAWCTRYSAVHAAVKLCRGLQGDVAREGLRNALWRALREQLSTETDPRVLEAPRVAEAEINRPTNPFSPVGLMAPSRSAASGLSHLLGERTAAWLSRLLLPPPPPLLPRGPEKQTPSPQTRLSSRPAVTQKPARLSLRQEISLSESRHEPAVDFDSRTERDLMKVVEDQWQKELRLKQREEEEKESRELEERQKQEEVRFEEVMRKRREKLNKKTKPYELPGMERAANATTDQ